ncbi:C-type mannose receptor 2-like [Branchiostoma lanceolatum]|uniref:C-type mannose receptor 2-like n=1 Tax=Branchiostoma lanceolatum TaxID=7740 RepID=UPI003453C15E
MAGPCKSGFFKWAALVLIATTATVTAQVCPIADYVSFNGVCYKDFAELKTYDEARQTCAADRGMLAMPKDSGTNTFIHNLGSNGTHWIGLNDLNNEGHWLFEDGKPLGNYSSWGPGEPNDLGGEDCVVVHGSTHDWIDVSCSLTRGFICQLGACPAGYGDDYGFGKCLYVHKRPLIYSMAIEHCQSMGGRIFQLDNAADVNVMKTIVERARATSNKYFGVWVGLTDEAAEGTFVWEDGTLSASGDFSDWAPQPNDHNSGRRDCVQMKPKFNWQWVVRNCGRAKNLFLCEPN